MTSAEVLRGSRIARKLSPARKLWPMSGVVNLGTCLFRYCAPTMLPPRGRTTAMSLLRHLSRPRQYVCQACVRRQHTLARGERPAKRWDAETADVDARSAAWEEQAGRIRSGAQQSMLSVLEERGFVKDVAG